MYVPLLSETMLYTGSGSLFERQLSVGVLELDKLSSVTLWTVIGLTLEFRLPWITGQIVFEQDTDS